MIIFIVLGFSVHEKQLIKTWHCRDCCPSQFIKSKSFNLVVIKFCVSVRNTKFYHFSVYCQHFSC